MSNTRNQRKALPPSGQAPRRLYLDLRQYCEEQDASSTPYTETVQGFYALDEALSELEEKGGWRSIPDSGDRPGLSPKTL